MKIIVAVQSYDFYGKVSKVSNVNANVNDVINVDSAVKFFNGWLITLYIIVNETRAQCCSDD